MREPSHHSLSDAEQSLLVELIEAEERGEHHPLEHWLSRFPEHHAFLKRFMDDRAAFDEVIQRRAAQVPQAVRYFGDYELLEVIARGGMGIVYRASQTSLKRIVALKMVLHGPHSAGSHIDRFRSEAQAAGQLDHPNIVPLYEVGIHEGQHYYTMKYITHGSLADRLAQQPASALPFDTRTAVLLLTKVARAVHYAHQFGILHRDLKPANILLQQNEEQTQLEPLVADFGLAKRLEWADQFTQTGAIIGTPCYMAPEQARAEKHITTAVDVYSLGAILYELLTGQPPFRDTSVARTLERLQQHDPVRLRQLQPTLPVDLETICLKCLAKEPEKRYNSAESLADDLDRWMNGLPITARPVGFVERSVKWARRRPAVATLAASLMLSLLLGLGCILYFWQQSSVAEQRANNAAEAERLERIRAQEAEQQVTKERDRASLAAVAEKKERLRAQEAETQSTIERNRAEQRLYYLRVAAAYRYWKDNNLTKMKELLEACEPRHRDWEWKYLHRQLTPEVKQIAGISFQVTRDQQHMLVKQPDQCYAWWSVPRWEKLRQLPVEPGWTCTLSPDGTCYVKHRAVMKPDGHPRTRMLLCNTTNDEVLREWLAVPLQAMEITSVCISPDNSLICVSGAQSNCAQGGYAASTAIVLDAKSGVPRHEFLTSGIHAAFSPDGKTLAAFTEQMELFDEPGFSSVGKQTLPGVRYWPTGKLLRERQLLNRRASWIELFDVETGKSLGKLQDPEFQQAGPMFTWNHDGTRIATLDGSLAHIHDVASRKIIRTLNTTEDTPTIGHFTPNGQLLTGGYRASIQRWNLTDGKPVQLWRGHQQHITSLAVVNAGTQMISGSGDGSIRCWDLAQVPGFVDAPAHHHLGIPGGFHWSTSHSRDGKQMLVLDENPLATIFQAAFSKDPNEPIGSYSLKLIDSRTQKSLKQFPTSWHSGSMVQQGMQLQFTPDGQHAIGCMDHQVVFLDLNTGKEQFMRFGDGYHVCLRPDGKQFVTLTGMARHPGIPSPALPTPYAMPSSSNPASPRPNGIQVKGGSNPNAEVVTGKPAVAPYASENFATTITFWSFDKREELFRLFPSFKGQEALWSPDGNTLAVAGENIKLGPWEKKGDMVTAMPIGTQPELWLFDVNTRKTTHALKGMTQRARGLCFSPDARHIAAASWDGNVYLWNVATGQLLHTMRGHQGYVWSCCFSADGKRLFSVGNDATLKIWDPATGEEILTLAQAGGKFKLALDHHGQLTGHGDYFFRRWNTR